MIVRVNVCSFLRYDNMEWLGSNAGHKFRHTIPIHTWSLFTIFVVVIVLFIGKAFKQFVDTVERNRKADIIIVNCMHDFGPQIMFDPIQPNLPMNEND